MVTGPDTIRQTLNILRKHFTKGQVQPVLKELLEVKGNASFEETIRILYRNVQEWER